MASPVAHSLAGAVIYLALSYKRTFNAKEFWLVILAANVADLDLLAGVLMGNVDAFHRTLSHSFLGTFVAALIFSTYLWIKDETPVPRLHVMIILAVTSQLVVDWLSYDNSTPRGIPLLWPWSPEHYMSQAQLFLDIRRDHLLTLPVILHNLKAVTRELLILGPVALLAWWVAGIRRPRKQEYQRGA
jgi:membrane-bound metal-dependent hydrolase YbcI (DUF457 family)